jgi:hypothetical protein
VKAAGAFSQLCILESGFGKAHSEANPFVLFYLLISVESRRKPKQTPPQSEHLELELHRAQNLKLQENIMM